jgi:capsid protein
MVLAAAAVDRILGSWGVQRTDPADQHFESGELVGSRGEWLYDNDGLSRGIVEAILDGAIGPQGLTFQPLYQADDNEEITEAELRVRRRIAQRINGGTEGTRFDAGGVLSRTEMSRITLACTIQNGDVWSIRCWKPSRPGRPLHATCWRIVHPARVSNPGDGADTDQLAGGIERDADGVPVAIHVRSSHPAARAAGRPTWSRVPIWSADGHLNVTHHCVHRSPDQLRPVGWFAPVMQLMRLFGRTLEAKTVADSLKASMGMIVECDDPKAMARMDKNGAVLDGSTKIVPGKIYYVRKGTVWKTLDFQYQGNDFGSWFDVVMTNLCAPFQVPPEFVLQRLSRTNLAASRVALMQAYRTFHRYQEDLIATTETPWNQSLIVEDIARGIIDVGGIADDETLDRVLAGAYLRPPRPLPDPLKEAQAHDVWHKRLGRSLSGIYGDAGMDLEDNAAQREQDDELLARRGIVLQGDSTGAANQPVPSADPNGGQDPPPASDAPAPNQALAAQIAGAA